MQRVERSRQFFRSFEAKSLRSRDFLTRAADDLTTICGSPLFLFLNSLAFVIWVIINFGFVPFIPVFDPYPFGLLTMFVSLEAIFLSIFVLVSQNRVAYINTIREEVNLAVNLIAEEEITKVLSILAEMREKVGIKEKDPELDKMLERINTYHIEQSVVHQLTRANKTLVNSMYRDFPDLFAGAVRKPFENIVTHIQNQHMQERPKKSD